MARLPTVGADTGTWGTVLNDYLTKSANLMALASSPSAGATTFDVAVVPTSLRVGSIIAIDAYTTQCELRAITGLSGVTVTVAALKFAHSAGDAVVAITDGVVPVSLFNITGDGSNEWQPYQRLALEAVPLALIIDGLFRRVDIQQPFCFMESSRTQNMWVRSDAGFAPVEAAGAMVMVGSNQSALAFTATASNDTFTVAAGHGMTSFHATNHTKTVFSAPYGETLPGGVTSGQVYYIDTVPNSTTFTVSATFGGGILNVTSDGAGHVTTSILELSRMYWESPRIDLASANLNGLICSLQQPSWTRNMRIEMDSAATTSAVGWHLTGQISSHANVEINTHENCVGLRLTGTGHNVYGFNDNGSFSADTGIKIEGDNISVHDVWTENCGNAGIEIAGTARGANIGGTWYFTSNDPTTAPALKVTSSMTSYRVGIIRTTTGGALYLNDTARSSQIIGGDFNHTHQGWSQIQSVVAPEPNARTVGFAAGNATVARTDGRFDVDTTGATRTITLPTAVGWGGWRVNIQNRTGSNNVIIDPTGAETINGASTFTLLPGCQVECMSDGSNYIVSGTTSKSVQTYSATNVSVDRTYDANATTLDELADIVGTLIADLRARQIVA